jgi:hypothetical protein
MPPPVASPNKPKRSAFQHRLQQQAEAPSSLTRTHSARGKKDGQEGGQVAEAGTPLGQRKRLLKEGELRKWRMQARREESESGDEEWGGLTKGKKKKGKKDKKEARLKRRRVLSDEEESEEEAGPAAGRKQGKSAVEEGGPEKGREEKVAAVVPHEEEDRGGSGEKTREENPQQWRVEGAAQQADVLPSDTGGASKLTEPQSGTGAAKGGQQGSDVKSIADKKKRLKELKRKLEGTEGTGEEHSREKKVKGGEGIGLEHPKDGEEQTVEVEKGETSKGQEAGSELVSDKDSGQPGLKEKKDREFEGGFRKERTEELRSKKKKKKVRRLSEVDDAGPEIPGLQTSMKAPKEKKREVSREGGNEIDGREKKRQRIEGEEREKERQMLLKDEEERKMQRIEGNEEKGLRQKTEGKEAEKDRQKAKGKAEEKSWARIERTDKEEKRARTEGTKDESRRQAVEGEEEEERGRKSQGKEDERKTQNRGGRAEEKLHMAGGKEVDSVNTLGNINGEEGTRGATSMQAVPSGEEEANAEGQLAKEGSGADDETEGQQKSSRTGGVERSHILDDPQKEEAVMEGSKVARLETSAERRSEEEEMLSIVEKVLGKNGGEDGHPERPSGSAAIKADELRQESGEVRVAGLHQNGETSFQRTEQLGNSARMQAENGRVETPGKETAPQETRASAEDRTAEGAEHPFLEEMEDEQPPQGKHEAGGAVESRPPVKGWVPRQLQVANRKVASKEDAQGGVDRAGGKVQLAKATGPALEEKAEKEVPKASVAAEAAPVSTVVDGKVDEVTRTEAPLDAKSTAAVAPVLGEKAAPKAGSTGKAKNDSGRRGAEREQREPSPGTTSSSETSSLGASSDGSELAQEDVVQPVKRTPGGDTNKRPAAGKEGREAEQPGTSRSTVLQVANPKRRGLSPLRLGRRALSEDRDSPPPSRAERRERDRRDERDRDRSSYRAAPPSKDRWRSPSRRGGERERDRDRGRYWDDRDRDRDRGRSREWDREYERDRDRGGSRYRRGESPPWRDRRGGSERGEHDRRSAWPEKGAAKEDERRGGAERSRSPSLLKEGGSAKKAGPPSRGGSRQLSPPKEAAPSKDGGLPTKGAQAGAQPSSAEMKPKGPLARVLPEVGIAGGVLASPPVDAKVSTPPHTGGSGSTLAPGPKAASESSRMAGMMAPPPPPAAASGAAALGGHEEARKLFMKLMKEAKDTKHRADNMKVSAPHNPRSRVEWVGKCSIWGTRSTERSCMLCQTGHWGKIAQKHCLCADFTGQQSNLPPGQLQEQNKFLGRVLCVGGL